MLKFHFTQFVNGHSIDDGKTLWLVVIIIIILSSVVNDGELQGLSSFLSFFSQVQKTTTSLIVVSWVFSSNGEYDNKLGGS